MKVGCARRLELTHGYSFNNIRMQIKQLLKLVKEPTGFKKTKFDKILLKKNGIDDEIKIGKITKEEKINLKSYSTKKAIKIGKYKI